MDLFDGLIPYGIPLINTFIVNSSDQIQGQLNMDSYRVPTNAHEVKNDLQ